MQKLKISFDEFKNLVNKLCHDISLDSIPDVIVGINRGGLLPALMLSHYFNVPLKPIELSLRDHVTLNVDKSIFNSGKKILVVDDINDTGNTLNCLIESLDNNLTNIKFAVIVDNLSSKMVRKVDYSAMEINKAEVDVWIDFPYEEWWTK